MCNEYPDADQQLHVRRLLCERDELAEKLNKLNDFIISPYFKQTKIVEQYMMIDQSHAMHVYLGILNRRCMHYGHTAKIVIGVTV